jgi:microcompartment protein CcmK/EutM
MAKSPRVRGSGFRLRLGTFIVELGDSRPRLLLAAAAVGAGAGACEYLIHEALQHSRFAQSIDALIDAMVIGIVTAIAFAIWLFAARERRKRVVSEMAKVKELNHNVRNALQVIAHSHYGSTDDHTDIVLESVDRIERTLKELFPGAEPPREVRAPVVWSGERRRRARS